LSSFQIWNKEMKIQAQIITITILTTLFISCSTNTPYATSIPKQKFRRCTSQEAAFQIDNLLNDAPTQMGWWGIKVQYVNTGEVIYERNATKMFSPASNVKLFTTAAALCLLGPEYRYETDFVTNGTIENGILKGDLIIRGSGDPTWDERFHTDKYDSIMVHFVDLLKAQGITRINGDIIGDDNIFDDIPLGDGWMWDDERDSSSAQLSGLSFRRNYIDYKLTPNYSNIGSPVIIESSPQTSYVNLRNDLTTVSGETDSDWSYGRNRETNDHWFEGSYSTQAGVKERFLTIHNPTLFTVHVLKEHLMERGILVDGNPMDADDLADSINYKQTKILFTFVSNPMSDIVIKTNHPSQNFIAETLVKTMDKEFGGEGSSKEGMKVQMALFDSLGIDIENLYLRDGSGLSRYDLVSPNNIASLLQVMWNHEYHSYYVDSFPIAGVIGTIQKRMLGSSAVGNVHAKSGNMTNVSCLSGYAWTESDEPIIFSIMANNYMIGNSKVKPIQDKIAIILSDME
jgi:serine-type D-Ala-D-Ala carboxypeptidase/endopeptidase (penicillin-binding protein 4)